MPTLRCPTRPRHLASLRCLWVATACALFAPAAQASAASLGSAGDIALTAASDEAAGTEDGETAGAFHATDFAASAAREHGREVASQADAPAEAPAATPDAPSGWPNPNADEPMNFWVQRQEYGYWTHYLLQTPEGAPWGVVERRHWRQPWRRCFEGVDGDGVLRARATQPWLSPGNLFSWQAEMRFTDAAGQPLGHLSGSLWTLKAASYTLYDTLGTAVAEASVDDCGQGVMVYAYGTRRLLATLLREQQATRGSDRWVVRVEPGAPLPPAAWPLVASFFADVWSRVARGCVEGL